MKCSLFCYTFLGDALWHQGKNLNRKTLLSGNAHVLPLIVVSAKTRLRSERGKIDRIIVKSMSRLGRDALELIKRIREWKALGITLYLETERSNTMTTDHFTIDVLEGLAQAERRGNQVWHSPEHAKRYRHMLMYGNDRSVSATL